MSMDWTEQTNEMMKSWTDAQKELWSSWMRMMPGAPAATGGWPGMPGMGGMMGGMPGMGGMMGGMPGMGGMMGGMPGFDPGQWLKMMGDSWGGEGSSAQRVAGNLVQTPDMLVRSMNLLMKAWQVVAPKVEQGKPWQPDLQKVMEQWRQQFAELPERAQATSNEFAELTKTLFEKWTPIKGPWMQMVTQATASGHPGAAFMGGTGGLNRIMGMGEGLLPMLSGVSDLPRATVIRQKMGKMLEAVDALGDLRKAQAAFHKKMGDAMGTAVERTMDHLSKVAEKGEPITSVRDLIRTWFTVADKTLNEASTSEDFSTTQDEMIKALLTYKVKQRAALEIIYDAMEIPTRSNLDEAYRDIQELKREVRRLRRELGATSRGAIPDSPGKKAAAKKVASKEPAGKEETGKAPAAS
jgi:class III poly(R)-hydroxyalkanoic acid synthase PhaE subunit